VGVGIFFSSFIPPRFPREFALFFLSVSFTERGWDGCWVARRVRCLRSPSRYVLWALFWFSESFVALYLGRLGGWVAGGFLVHYPAPPAGVGPVCRAGRYVGLAGVSSVCAMLRPGSRRLLLGWMEGAGVFFRRFP